MIKIVVTEATGGRIGPVKPEAVGAILGDFNTADNRFRDRLTAPGGREIAAL